MDGEQQAEIIDRCVERLLQGESLEHILLSYPDHRAQLIAALEPARTLLQATVAEPSPRARGAAMNAMLRQVRTEAARPALPGIFTWIGRMRARPLAFQALAVVAAIMVFGGLGIGASAATGTAPAPVRTFLGISSDSPSSVRLSGPIISLNSRTIVLRTQAGERTIALTSSTSIHRDRDRLDFSALLVGEDVDVAATEHDGTVTAREIRVSAGVPTDTPTVGGPAAGDDAASDTPEGEHPAGDGDHHEGDSAPTAGRDDGDRTSTPSSGATPKHDDHDATRTPDHDDGDKTPSSRTPTRTPEPGKTPGEEDEHSGD